MNKDKTRFVSADELAKVLECDVNTAIELAIKAEAMMRIGSKVWYDKDKAKKYQQNNEKPLIKWLSAARGGMFYDDDKNDVLLTLNKSTKGNQRLRISIKNEALEEIKLGKKIMVGITDDRMYFTFSDDEGYAVEKQKERITTTVTCRGGIEKFAGSYPLHRYADDLVFIEIEK